MCTLISWISGILGHGPLLLHLLLQSSEIKPDNHSDTNDQIVDIKYAMVLLKGTTCLFYAITYFLLSV